MRIAVSRAPGAERVVTVAVAVVDTVHEDELVPTGSA
jgi:hypothetical protein